ncbi:hypothetical protein [Dictyobacter aurantiacus]|uniref:Uncharacterized protein n=1 Tax=Dictyobacter aurantiacus TaxID=1936993 RepID=A0A401ZPT7_9CHLR|nr:hypothetical protein [Dictyobacter aurantiacus]GCE08887.1 hypothetical protein KDAU_62160 [Dictyobacter aurantiacus]
MGGIASEYANVMPPKFFSEEAATYMQQSTIEIQNMHSQAISQPEHVLSTDAAQFTNYERVDPSTLKVIATLFPSGGLEFLARLLQHATIKQATLPGIGVREYVAVINARTLRALAKIIKWGYDTTHKYVSLFDALNLLSKVKDGKELKIVIHMGAYQAPKNLQRLDKLITKSRPKVQQFARNVKGRLLKHNLLSISPEPSDEAQAFSECDPQLQQKFYGPMLEIMESEGIDRAKGQHVLFRMVNEVLGKMLFPKLADEVKQPFRSTMVPESKSEVYHSQNPKGSGVYHPQSSRNSKVYLPQHEGHTKYQGYTQSESTRSTDLQQKVYPVGRLSPESKISTPEKSTDREKYSAPEQKVYLEPQNESTLQPSRVDSMSELLHVYSDLLDDQTVDWEQMDLPKQFFEGVYEQIYAYYVRLHNTGLLTRTVRNVWQSVEISIIKKQSVVYDVDSTAACIYVFQCTGREYHPPVTQSKKVYPAPASQSVTTKKRFSRDQYPEDWYQPPAHRDDRKVDWLQLTVDPQKTLVDHNAEQEVDYEGEKSTAREIFSDNHGDKSTINSDNHSEKSTAGEPQIEKSTWTGDFFEQEPKKVSRLNAEIDLKAYGDEFYNVIRNGNIYILFSNIYNNVTLRNSAARFLARLFDNNESEKICKINRTLLKKYSPENITTAFIETVLSMHEPGYDSLQNPGAYFTSRCKYYSNQSANEEISRIVEIYSSMTYEELMVEMKSVLSSGKKLREKVYSSREKF